MVKKLTLQCEKGFVQIFNDDDPITEILSGNIVASVAVKGKDDIGKNIYGLMPSFQSMRLAIAECLVLMEADPQAFNFKGR